MAELVELYTKGIKRKLANYWAAWLPGTHVKIGDVGTLNGYLFEKEATLDGLNIKYYTESQEQPTSLDISSDTDVSISFKAAGETNPAFEHIGAAEAGIRIEFGSQGSFILQAPEVLESEVGDRLNLRRQLVDAFRKDVWDKNWFVITRVVQATSATVLISKSSNASLEFSAKANLSSAHAALGTADAGLTVKHERGDTFRMISGRDVTPLFQLSRIKTGFFAPPRLQTKSLRAYDPSLADLTPSHVIRDTAVEKSLVFDTLLDEELV